MVGGEDHVDEGTVEVAGKTEESPFNVNITDHDENVGEGDEVNVGYDVSYSGEVPMTQDIDFKVDGDVMDSEEVTLIGHNYENLWQHGEHEDFVRSVRYAEIDGRHVVFSASRDETVVAYDYENESVIWQHKEHNSEVVSVSYAEISGRHVVFSGSADETVMAYDYENESMIWQHEEHGSIVHSVSYTEIDGRNVVLSGSEDETVVAYDYENKSVIWQHEEHGSVVHSVSHAEIGGRHVVFSGSADQTVVAYDYEEEVKIWQHEEHGEHYSTVTSVTYAEIGGRHVVFSGSADETVLAYDYEEEVRIWQHEEHDDVLNSVTYARIDGKDVVFSGAVDNTVAAVEYITGAVTHHEGDFTWQTEEGDAGGHDIEVASEDDQDKVSVEVKEPPSFDVEIVDHDEEVLEGEEVKVGSELENTGGIEGSQTIEFLVDGEVEETLVITLDGGGSYEGEFTWTAGKPYGERKLSVKSEDDESEVTVEVKEEPGEAEFSVRSLDWDENPKEGDTVSIEYEIENIGGTEGNTTIELWVDGSLVDEEEVTLAQGESSTGELSWQTEEGDAGECEMELNTGDDQQQTSITVAEDTDGGDDGDGLLWWILPIVAIIVIGLVLVVFLMKRKGGEEEETSSQHQPIQQTQTTSARAGTARTCPDCGQELGYIEEYERWYCEECEEYK